MPITPYLQPMRTRPSRAAGWEKLVASGHGRRIGCLRAEATASAYHCHVARLRPGIRSHVVLPRALPLKTSLLGGQVQRSLNIIARFLYSLRPGVYPLSSFEAPSLLRSFNTSSCGSGGPTVLTQPTGIFHSFLTRTSTSLVGLAFLLSFERLRLCALIATRGTTFQPSIRNT